MTDADGHSNLQDAWNDVLDEGASEIRKRIAARQRAAREVEARIQAMEDEPRHRQLEDLELEDMWSDDEPDEEEERLRARLLQKNDSVVDDLHADVETEASTRASSSCSIETVNRDQPRSPAMAAAPVPKLPESTKSSRSKRVHRRVIDAVVPRSADGADPASASRSTPASTTSRAQKVTVDVNVLSVSYNMDADDECEPEVDHGLACDYASLGAQLYSIGDSDVDDEPRPPSALKQVAAPLNLAHRSTPRMARHKSTSSVRADAGISILGAARRELNDVDEKRSLQRSSSLTSVQGSKPHGKAVSVPFGSQSSFDVKQYSSKVLGVAAMGRNARTSQVDASRRCIA